MEDESAAVKPQSEAGETQEEAGAGQARIQGGGVKDKVEIVNGGETGTGGEGNAAGGGDMAEPGTQGEGEGEDDMAEAQDTDVLTQEQDSKEADVPEPEAQGAGEGEAAEAAPDQQDEGSTTTAVPAAQVQEGDTIANAKEVSEANTKGTPEAGLEGGEGVSDAEVEDKDGEEPSSGEAESQKPAAAEPQMSREPQDPEPGVSQEPRVSQESLVPEPEGSKTHPFQRKDTLTIPEVQVVEDQGATALMGPQEEKRDSTPSSQEDTPRKKSTKETMKLRAYREILESRDYGSPYSEALAPVGGVTISSRLETASPNDACKDNPDNCFHHPLSLHWSFGFNSKLPVHNISEGNRKMIFYVSAHTGVLFDCVNNKQCLLQGHNNPISCTAVSGDRRWLATADSGRDCVLIVWDSFTGIPVRTIFDGGDGEGMAAISISPDSQFMATISAGKSTQVVSVWDWTADSDSPLCQVSLGPDYSYQTYLTFHHDNPHQLVSNSEDLVVFYYWKEKEIKFNAHPVLDKDFNKTIGRFYQSVFVPDSSLALTGTSEGHCIVWENGASDDEPHIKRGVKLMKLHDSPLTVMCITLSMIVTGDKEGKVKFFDSELKMLNWYEDTMRYGPLCSISFSYSPTIALLKSTLASGRIDPNVLGDHSYPSESTKAAAPFVIPDFTISTTTASIVHFTSNSSTPEILLSEHDASITALATHPFLTQLITTGYSCKMKLWDYGTKLVLATRDFKEPNFIQCVCFDPKGEFISIGFTNGTLQVLDAITLTDAGTSFRYSRDAITKISFSHDSQFMATADLDRCVSLYTAQPDPQKPWSFLAKYRPHFKTIESLMFGVALDSNVPRLLSLGKDRLLVEYDLANSSEDDLQLLSSERVEQSAIPTAMAWYPPLTTESFIMLINNQYKIKLYNCTTKMCRRTLLGPLFGSPLKKVIVLPAPILRGSEYQEVRRYLAYCTNNKVGLLLLPHDGNPHNSKCMVAHPGKVAEMTCSFDGKYVFTAGGEDCAVNMWNINTEALETASLLGGEDLQPFYTMLEGGRDGEFFNELEEYFYYAQIRSEGPDVTATRKVSSTIPIEEIPYVMRAIGFYPSEQEIEDMMNEVKFSRYVETGKYVTKVDLGMFIRLYINHRPVFGLTPLQVGQAFKMLGKKQEGEKYWSIDRNMLLSLLQAKGEHLTETEIVEYLMTLLGYTDNPEVDGSFTEDVATALEEIPERISAPMFAEDILGLSTQ